jgi:hypothetical protein
MRVPMDLGVGARFVFFANASACYVLILNVLRGPGDVGIVVTGWMKGHGFTLVTA